jgi:hypothetical protein
MSDANLTFRQLEPHEVDAGYAVLLDVFGWMQHQGIRQWSRPLPREIYDQRHARGENFGLFAGGGIDCIVSLVRGIPEHWHAEVPRHDAMWLATLACRRHGQGLGRTTVGRALAWQRDFGEKEVYLDCKRGVLDLYYAELGFARVVDKMLVFGEKRIDATLMRADLTA